MLSNDWSCSQRHYRRSSARKLLLQKTKAQHAVKNAMAKKLASEHLGLYGPAVNHANCLHLHYDAKGEVSETILERIANHGLDFRGVPSISRGS